MTGLVRSSAVVDAFTASFTASALAPDLPQPSALLAMGPFMSLVSSANLTVGKYLISPLVRVAEGGGYSASVSVKSGRGSGTHDRVLRLIGLFRTPETARSHAVAEGLDYLRPRFGALGVPPLNIQAAG